MSVITYQTVLRLINNINSFAEQSDQKIQQLWNNFNNSKQSLEEQYNQFMKKASAEHNNNSAVIKKKAMALKENADKIYQEVLALDTTLAKVDKYYVKTRDKKTEELAQITETSIVDEADIFVALEKAKEQYKIIATKYSKETLPAMIDGIAYMFSKQRKQDYEELIVLKNTLEKLMEEIKKISPNLLTIQRKQVMRFIKTRHPKLSRSIAFGFFYLASGTIFKLKINYFDIIQKKYCALNTTKFKQAILYFFYRFFFTFLGVVKRKNKNCSIIIKIIIIINYFWNN